ncbi:hypothetical protein GHT07_04550 [Caenimonas koreensis DSM 17982]|uniref:GP-PDE domain-containing protein n=1 Tax=Caenimonas koreensis DSM 17982 TaxID=1121255 RepID=A0A844B097_9BURK|nr:hypothetical protein [Caenimonas koreensis DSM 17982]
MDAECRHGIHPIVHRRRCACGPGARHGRRLRRGPQQAHELGLKVIPWTINAPADIERLIGWGVDEIISDYPDRVRTVMQARAMQLPPPVAIR